ncbi:hypothetical protein JOF56_009250 [Kibdelosporangium banguiense]|uniref:Uncharacterized protein n=1 Tax=Kibdelosporangium banguiense TaxID=1365924 RepID=A0ABS4TY25_9PSEU|nr:hypothetical protein [Kibdelosporangium banguiense]
MSVRLVYWLFGQVLSWLVLLARQVAHRSATSWPA